MQAARYARLADDRLAPVQHTRADQVADQDKPGGDADPHLQRNTRAVVSFGAAQGKPGLHSVLGVMLVGQQIAEIGQHPVAHVLGDERRPR